MSKQEADAKHVRVRFYAEFRRVAGVDGIDLECEGYLTIEQALARIANQIPALRGEVELVLTGKELGSSMLIMVRNQTATPDTVIWPGDVVRLLPPIGGG